MNTTPNFIKTILMLSSLWILLCASVAVAQNPIRAHRNKNAESIKSIKSTIADDDAKYELWDTGPTLGSIAYLRSTYANYNCSQKFLGDYLQDLVTVAMTSAVCPWRQDASSVLAKWLSRRGRNPDDRTSDGGLITDEFLDYAMNRYLGVIPDTPELYYLDEDLLKLFRQSSSTDFFGQRSYTSNTDETDERIPESDTFMNNRNVCSESDFGVIPRGVVYKIASQAYLCPNRPDLQSFVSKWQNWAIDVFGLDPESVESGPSSFFRYAVQRLSGVIPPSRDIQNFELITAQNYWIMGRIFHNGGYNRHGHDQDENKWLSLSPGEKEYILRD